MPDESQTMTVDDAIRAIPPGWRLRLTNWQDQEGSGWGAELFSKTDSKRGYGDEDDPASAIIAAVASIS